MAQTDAPPRIDIEISEETSLSRLVDLAASINRFSVDYDRTQLDRIKATVRLDATIHPDELWALTNDLLTSRGYTSIRRPGSPMLSVVELDRADDQARIEPDSRALSTNAGFATIRVSISQRTPAVIMEAVRTVLSPAGLVERVGTTDSILISDVTPRLRQAIALIDELDVPGSALIVEIIPVQYVGATRLATLVTTAVASKNAISKDELLGKVSPIEDGDSVMLVAPKARAAQWREMIEMFDRRQSVTTRSYQPRHFSLSEVSALMESIGRDTSPRGSNEQWRLVQNDLTGTIVVTATTAEHERIEELIGRLDAAPAEARRPARTFPIRNRSVTELLAVLQQIIDIGATPGTEASGGSALADEEPVLDETGSVSPGLDLLSLDPSRLTLAADEATNTIIAIGDERELDRLAVLIETLDVRQPQVLMEVLVVSLNESDAIDLGVELQAIGVSGQTLFSLGSLFGLGSAFPDGGLSDPVMPGGQGFSGVVLNPGDFSLLIRALETLNQGRSLNRPKVLVGNNKTATLDAVLQQPLTSINASDTVATTSFAGTQDAGTQVTVTPQIAAGDHVALEYNVSISAFVGESDDPSIPPPRQQNQLESEVTIPDSYTVAVGGLEIISDSESTSQVPILGDIPILGEAFKNRSSSRSRTRFYVFIRPTILRHNGFEDLKYLSDQDLAEAAIDDGWPDLKPAIIR